MIYRLSLPNYYAKKTFTTLLGNVYEENVRKFNSIMTEMNVKKTVSVKNANGYNECGVEGYITIQHAEIIVIQQYPCGAELCSENTYFGVLSDNGLIYFISKEYF